jgi:hypothetical protein
MFVRKFIRLIATIGITGMSFSTTIAQSVQGDVVLLHSVNGVSGTEFTVGDTLAIGLDAAGENNSGQNVYFRTIARVTLSESPYTLLYELADTELVPNGDEYSLAPHSYAWEGDDVAGYTVNITLYYYIFTPLHPIILDAKSVVFTRE